MDDEYELDKLIELRHLADRTRKRRNVLGVAAIVAGAVILLGREELGILGLQAGLINSKAALLIPFAVATFLLAYGIGLFLAEYLRGGRLQSVDFGPLHTTFGPAVSADIALLEHRVRKLEAAEPAAQGTDKVAEAQAFERLRDQLIPSVVSDLEKRFGEDTIEQRRVAAIGQTFSDSQRRLLREIESLGRRGNLNLVVGVLTTALAIGLLAYLVLWNSQPFVGVPSVLAHYLPRLTLVVFVEVFSFFFLRLYRATLLEIRTYQEDLTRLAVQEVALLAAWGASDPAARTTLSEGLLKASLPQPMGQVKSADTAATVDLAEKFAKIFATVKGEAKG